MRKTIAWLRRNMLTAALILTSVSILLTVYTVIENRSEREASILRNCKTQNAENRATVKELNRQYAAPLAAASPSKRAALMVTKNATVLLIGDLAPYQDCQALLAKSTSH